MRDKPITLELFENDFAAWQKSVGKKVNVFEILHKKLSNELDEDKRSAIEKDIVIAKAACEDQQDKINADKNTLTEIINAINNEDSALMETRWLSASNEVRDAFIKKKDRLEAEFMFLVTDLPLTAVVPDGIDTKSISNNATESLHYMRSLASRRNSKHLSVFNPGNAMEHVFPTLNILIKIEQSDSILWRCFDKLGLNLGANKALRDFVIKLYHCAIANPKKGASSSYELFASNTENQIKLITNCVTELPFSASFRHKNPAVVNRFIAALDRVNLIEVALFYNNINVADTLFAIAGKNIKWSNLILLKLMFPLENKDTSAALNWFFEHVDAVTLNSLLTYQCAIFKAALTENDLLKLDLIWSKIDTESREQLISMLSQNIMILNEVIATGNIQTFEWLWSHMNTEQQQALLRDHCKPYGVSYLNPFHQAVRCQKLDIVNCLWESADGNTKQIFERDLRAFFNMFALGKSVANMKWIWEIANPELQKHLVTMRDFHAIRATSNIHREILEWLWQHASKEVRQEVRTQKAVTPDTLKHLEEKYPDAQPHPSNKP